MSDTLRYITKIFLGSPTEVGDAITVWINDHTDVGHAVDYGILRQMNGDLCLWMTLGVHMISDTPSVAVVALAHVSRLS